MSPNEEFDELARQKLAERDFPYREGDWQQARALIDAQRGRRNRGAWFMAGSALLLLVGLAWLFMHGAARPERQVAEAPAPGTPPPAGAPGGAAAQALAAAQPHPGDQATAVAMEEEGAGRNERSNAVHAIPSSARPGIYAARTNAGNAVPAQGPSATTFRTRAADTTAARPSSANARGSDAFAHAESRPPEAQVAPLASAGPPAAVNGHVPGTHRPTGPFGAAQPPAQQGPPGNSDQAAAKPASPADTAASLAATQCLPQDTASAMAPPAPPPIVAARAPWEVSIMGGLFSTASRYAGGTSAEWSAGVGRAQVAGFGAELMHAGRNISIGIGIHYGNYAERIRTGAVDATSTSLNQYWYLRPVTTTVLVITDTLPGVPPSYAGHSSSTTVNVLTQGTDTVVTAHRLREARDQVNRASYLEVPLLADAHVVQGRWTLGLRGGPSVGLLTGRRGALPNPAGDGYLALNDVPFREFTLGYTARAYVRYRFNAAWSAGVGPAVHGQVLNSLAGTGLQRRSTAIGAMVDLTYRLR